MNELFKPRSAAACISEAYATFCSNFKKIFRKTWLAALVFAVAGTACMMVNIPDKSIHDAGMSNPMLTFALMIGAGLLCAVALGWLLYCLLGVFSDMTKREKLRRVVGYFLLIALVGIIIGVLVSGSGLCINSFVSAEHQALAIIGTMCVVALVIGVAVLPLQFSTMKYLVDKNAKWRDMIGKDYRRGWRYWGFLFLVLLLTMLIVTIINMVIMIPFGIIMFSQVSNQLGMIDGDASGVPSGFLWLLIITTVITMFVIAYIEMWLFTTYYYAYGSIEARAAKRQEFLMNTNNIQQ